MENREPIGRGQGNELLNKLEAVGFQAELAQRIIQSKNNALAEDLLKVVEVGGLNPIIKKVAAGYNKNEFHFIHEFKLTICCLVIFVFDSSTTLNINKNFQRFAGNFYLRAG